MNPVAATDYYWLGLSSPVFSHALEVGYCLTLVRGVTPSEALGVMTAEPIGASVGLDGLHERQGDLLDTIDAWNESFIAGAFTVAGDDGDWALILHFDGGIGMRERFLEELSAGSRAVMHSSNGGKPMHFFHWYEDGELRTSFEWPTQRTGSTPDDLLPLMREVGFDLTGDAEVGVWEAKAAVLALAERLTGVHITEDLLQHAEYLLGHVPHEPAPEWSGIVIDISDPSS